MRCGRLLVAALVVCLSALAASSIERAGPPTKMPASPTQLHEQPLAGATASGDAFAAGVARQAEPMAPETGRYALLLDALAPSIRGQLEAALAAREATDSGDAREISRREREISLLLSAADYELYERLRESAREQDRLLAFSARIAATAPLSPTQYRALLRARLEHIYDTQALELRANAIDDRLSAMEQHYVRDTVRLGMERYEHDFLEHARLVLSDEQWSGLREFVSASMYTALLEP